MSALARADIVLLRAVRTLPHRPGTDTGLVLLSRFSDRARGWYLLTAVAAAVDGSGRRQWAGAGLSIAACEHLSVAIKHRAARQRPVLPGLPALAPAPSPLSFPSSHTADAVVAARLLNGLVPAPALWGLVALTAFSRMYLGLHYPSDVAAGVLIGSVVGDVALGLWQAV